jgi:hypothetical protein
MAESKLMEKVEGWNNYLRSVVCGLENENAELKRELANRPICEISVKRIVVLEERKILYHRL